MQYKTNNGVFKDQVASSGIKIYQPCFKKQLFTRLHMQKKTEHKLMKGVTPKIKETVAPASGLTWKVLNIVAVEGGSVYHKLGPAPLNVCN